MLPALTFLLLAATARAQAPAPTPSQPASQQPSQRPKWQPTLTLPGDLWQDVTAATIGTTAEWTNKVELADIDGDGRVDILFANGGDYDTPGEPVPSRVFHNPGPGKTWPEITAQVFGEQRFLARVIKVRDVNGDGAADVFVGTTFQTQSRLFLGDGKGAFHDATAAWLPQAPRSIGDAEFGDVDGDGDLDLAVADQGEGSMMKNAGARPRLWRNEGDRFVDITETHLPAWAVRFCWELELLDVDGDFDLDLLCSSKRSPGSFLAHNDGAGHFTDATAGRLPQFTNNYEFEAMDLDGDGVLDVVTINDGQGDQRFCEHVFRGDGKGGFADVTAARWPTADNPRCDDNMVAFLDFDSDGDADFLIGSLDGFDRLLVNDGKGNLRAGAPVFAGDPTKGTLGIAFADLDGDGRLDCVHAQGEVPKAMHDVVCLGKAIGKDTAAPSVGAFRLPERVAVGGVVDVRVRVHDRKSPCMPHDWQHVRLRVTQGDRERVVPLQWYGEYLWRASVPMPQAGEVTVHIEAMDAVGNGTTSQPQRVVVGS